jgi:hypothetical protein
VRGETAKLALDAASTASRELPRGSDRQSTADSAVLMMSDATLETETTEKECQMHTDTDIKPTDIYIGERENMIAEVAARDVVADGLANKRQAKWLVLPSGDAQWDTEYFPSRKAALEYARDLRKHYGARICFV